MNIFLIVDIDYTDDQTQLDSTKKGIQETPDKFNMYGCLTGLKINADKKKQCRSLTQQPFMDDDTLLVNVNRILIEQATDFKFLGVK